VATVQLTSALEELRRFNARRKFKAAVNTVQATISLQKTFSKVKSSSSGDGDSTPHAAAETTASPDAVTVELQ
jgi:calcium/calmodulin-dependent protein kinase I